MLLLVLVLLLRSGSSRAVVVGCHLHDELVVHLRVIHIQSGLLGGRGAMKLVAAKVKALKILKRNKQEQICSISCGMTRRIDKDLKW